MERAAVTTSRPGKGTVRGRFRAHWLMRPRTVPFPGSPHPGIQAHAKATSPSVNPARWNTLHCVAVPHPVSQTIHIHVAAPAKPPEDAPCNGCGVCCLAEPCPVGVLLSRKRHGACDALAWNDALQMYRCQAVDAPVQAIAHALPRSLRLLALPLGALLSGMARRWIAAGKGCDSSLQTQSATMPPQPALPTHTT